MDGGKKSLLSGGGLRVVLERIVAGVTRVGTSSSETKGTGIGNQVYRKSEEVRFRLLFLNRRNSRPTSEDPGREGRQKVGKMEDWTEG